MRVYLTFALLLSISFQAGAQTLLDQEPFRTNGELQAARERLELSRAEFSRSVRDMATWDFAVSGPNSHWAVAQIVAPANPTVYMINFTREELGGRDPKDPSVQVSGYVVRRYEGSVNLLTPLGAAPEKQLWPYRYERKGVGFAGENEFIDPFYSEGREAFSPFRHQPVEGETRNLALVSLPETIQSIETPAVFPIVKAPEFRPYFISEQSLKWVVPAQTFYNANPELFLPQKAAGNRKALSELLENENPFLFAAATRTLAQSGELGGDYVSKRLLNLDRFRQAVFVYSILFYSPEKQGKVLVEQIQTAIGEAKSSAQIEGLILGADRASRTGSERVIFSEVKVWPHGIQNYPQTSANSISPPLPPSLRLYGLLLSTLAEKQTALGITTENEKYLAGLTTRVYPPPRLVNKPIVR